MNRLYIIALLLFSAETTFAQCPITVDAGEDIYLCAPPQPTELNGSIDGSYLSFTWTPTTGLIFPNTLSPGVNVSQTTTYVLTGTAVDVNTNLIVNGDFESGNSGFSSDYVYNPGNLVPEGYYDVLSNPQDDHPGFAPCEDHTSGSGQMMVVNGAGTPGLDVWCQSIPIMPNTQYAFSAWVTSVVAASPALLQFSINGVTIGPIFSAPNQTCVWQNFYQTWNSGGATTANICIVNQNTVLGGNDFALDDLVFSPTCKVTDTVVVHVVNVTAVAAPPVVIIPCNGAQTTLSGVGSSVGANVTYLWTTDVGNIVSGENTLNPVVDAAGAYTLTVSVENNGQVCEKSVTVNVIENPNPLAAWINPPPPLGCGSNTVNLLGNSNQTASVTYQWTTQDGNIVSGFNSKNAVVNAPGIYEFLVTNTATGCTATAEVTVVAATSAPVAMATGGTLTCTQMQTNLLGTGSSTGANIAYAWTTVGGTIVSGQNNINAVAGAPGTYFLVVTNTNNNCASADTVVITGDLTPPALVLQTPGVLDCASDTLTLSGTVNPANAVFSWMTSGGGNIVSGANTLNPQLDAPGAYTLSATNPANGCTASVSVNVSQNIAPPTALVQAADSITCQSPSVTLTANGSSAGPNFLYQWTASGGGNIVSGDTTLSPLVNAAGTYTLLITSINNSCTAAAAVTVVADQNVVSAIANAPDTLTCANDTLAVDANGSSSGPTITYAWTTANGNIVSGANTAAPLVSLPGVYQLLVVNTANGCTATDLATVVQNAVPPALQIAAPGQLTCANPSLVLQGAVLNPPGVYDFSWTAANGGNISGAADTTAVSVNAPGAYTFSAFNVNTGCSNSTSVNVDAETGTPIAQVSAPDQITCAQPMTTLSSAGSSTGGQFAYQWTAGAGGHIFSGANTPAPLVDAPGVYTLLLTNIQNGCTDTDSVTVLQNLAVPPADAGPDALLTCTNPVFGLLANNGQPVGNLQFAWSSPAGNFLGDPDSAAVAVDQAGTYFLLVTDPVNGCTAVDSVQITANQLVPALSIAAPPTLTCVQITLTLQANASGSSPNLTYDWQTANGQFVSGQTGANPVVDAPGLYALTVTDLANGCFAVQTVSVAQDTAAPAVFVAPAPLLTCVLTQINLQAAGTGDASWSTPDGNIASGGDDFGNAVVDAPGLYVLSVVEPANGCTAQASVSVLENIAPPTVNAGANDTLSCAVNSLTLGAAGAGQGAISFAWSASAGGNILTGANSAAPDIDAEGIYSVVVTDAANGCTASDALQIFNDANAPLADAGLPATLTCALTQITLGGSGSNGLNFIYTWSTVNGNITGNGNTLTPSVDAPGTYQLLVTNTANGCTALDAVTIPVDVAPPTVDAGPTALLTCAETTQALNASASATNGGNLVFSWQTADGNVLSGNNTLTPVVNGAGTYALQVLNQLNGCIAGDATTVGIDTAAPVALIDLPAALTCIKTTADLSAVVHEPLTGFTFVWTTAGGHFLSGENTLTPVVDDPGTYFLTVENEQNGCTATAAIAVAEDLEPPDAQLAPAGVITCLFPQISLDASASLGSGPLNFAWTAGNGGLIVSATDIPAPTVAAAGIYTVVVTNEINGCTDEAALNVTIDTIIPATAIISPLPLTCVRDTVTIDASASDSGPNFNAFWITPDGHIVDGELTLYPSADEPGNYILRIENLTTGCIGTANIALLQDVTPPQAEAGFPVALDCLLPEATLQGSSTTPGSLAFAWSTADGQLLSGAATAQPLAGAPGLYTLTVTDLANGCTAADAVTVSEVPPPDFAPATEQPDCLLPRGAIDFGAVTGGTGPFRYSHDGGQTFQDAPVADNLAAGLYELIVQDAHGCTAEAEALLEEPVYPTVELPDFVAVDLGSEVQLLPQTTPLPTQIAAWQWSPPDGLSCSDCPEPIAQPLRSALYTLTITDLNGCTASARVQLQVKRGGLYAPNIFTPDGDGTNDFFRLFGSRSVTDIRSLTVFDRWGNEVYFGEHLDPLGQEGGWDGKYRGTELNPGVFVWQAVVEFLDGEVAVFAGDVTLER